MTIFPSPSSTATHSAVKTAAVTPNDGADLPDGLCRALWVGGEGNVEILAEQDLEAVVIAGVGTGMILPIKVIRVLSGNTTATNIVALY